MAYATRSDVTIPLRHLPQIPPAPAVLGEIFERPRKLLPHREGSAAPEGFTDPVLQGPTAQAGAPTTGANFEGVGNVNGVLPPDPSGDIGPNHYVQTVNLSFAIWNRSGGLLYGPVANKTLWQGFGGPCQTENDGDPIVLYDHLADRWLLGQFALPNYPLGPFYQCIAVSQTGDPTGAWHRYEFLMSQNKLNDYPKFGVWPDGYYMSINQFQCNVVGCNWGGQGAVVFERTAMLSGAAARMVYFDLFSTDPNLGGMLPADLDGATLPPAGALNSFLQVDDNAWGYSGDQLQIWQFSANWANPSSSTFTHLADLGTSAFDSNLCGYSRNCIPQPGTPRKVDAISDRLMYRLQYRHFGTHQSLLVNHTVDVNGSDRAGIRWYELRKSGGGWGIFQQGTYSPDSIHRWMGSIAMNSLGDIALGYSKSSSSVFPSIYATGRLASDAPGQMTQAEIPIVDGGGSQTHTSGRWGDYSQMTVDATDDCTFWYTQEYYAVSGNAPWRTRVGSFKLRDCGPPPPPPAVHDVAVASVTAPSPVFVSTAQTVTVGVSNQGNQSETFTVSLADSLAATISSAQGITLAPGVSTTLNFSWTPNVTGSHVLTGTASTVPDETDTADNSGSAISLVNATVHDVAVTSISAPSPVFQGDTVNISVTVKNEGSFSESFNVSVTDTGGTTAGAVSPPQPVNLASGASQVLTFTWNTTNASTGIHTLTATAGPVSGETDTADNSKSTASNVILLAATKMHVADLDGSSVNNGSTWTAIVTITVKDGVGNPVQNAAVTGSWSSGGSGPVSCPSTGINGQCQLGRLGIRKKDGSVTFTVTNLTHATLTYDSAANSDPDGDSNGTSIAVPKP